MNVYIILITLINLTASDLIMHLSVDQCKNTFIKESNSLSKMIDVNQYIKKGNFAHSDLN